MAKNLFQWAEIFKALGSTYRLQIIQLLDKNRKMSVTDLQQELKISHKNTSRNLKILRSLNILKAQGKAGHVFYEINPEIDKEILQILKHILK